MLLVVAAAYLVGSIPFAFLLVRLTGRGDVRRAGSGNVGATNTLRVAGWKVALPVLLLDVGKGIAAVWVMSRVTADPAWHAAAGAAAVVGHCFPVWLGFSGGKGVATAAGVLLMLAPVPGLVIAGVFVAVLAVGRMVSLASMTAAAGYPVVLWLMERPRMPVVTATVVIALVVLWRHRANLERMIRGEEPRMGRRS